MRDLALLGRVLAGAINATGGKRLTQEQVSGLIATIVTMQPPLAPDVLRATIEPLLNVSQLNQELERFGLVVTDRAEPALIAAIRTAMKPTPPNGGKSK